MIQNNINEVPKAPKEKKKPVNLQKIFFFNEEEIKTFSEEN